MNISYKRLILITFLGKCFADWHKLFQSFSLLLVLQKDLSLSKPEHLLHFTLGVSYKGQWNSTAICVLSAHIVMWFVGQGNVKGMKSMTDDCTLPFRERVLNNVGLGPYACSEIAL